MNRLRTMLFSAMLVCIGFIGTGTVSAFSDNNEKVVIVPLRSKAPLSTARHRAPASVSMTAEYDGWSSAVLVTFSRNVGDVTVEVMNMTTGEYVNRSLDGIGMASIPVSGTNGIYTITVTLTSGTQYFGQFAL